MVKELANASDEQLLTAHRADRDEAFGELVRRYYNELYQFMFRFTGRASLAEDLVQETFLQVHLSADTFDPNRRFKPWLFAIGANKARDALRKRARRPVLELDASIQQHDLNSDRFIHTLAAATPLPDERLLAKESQDLVKEIVTEMPEPLREIIILAYYHRFPYKQIAEILDIPLGTVKSRLHAAIAHLAKRWKNRVGT